MRKLTKPVEHAGDVLITCISNFTDTNLKARLTSIKNLITAATNEFEAAAVASELHKIKPTNGIGGVVTTDEMVKIYDQKLAKRGQPEG